MTSAHARFKTGRYKWQGILLPAMAPFAGLGFLIVCYYLITGRFKEPEVGIVSTEQVPFRQVHCGKIPEHTKVYICVNKQNQLSFGVEADAEFQAAVIKKVATRHGVAFNSAQLAALQKLPFLTTDVEQLPAFLSLSSTQQARRVHASVKSTLSSAQLLECVTAARGLSAYSQTQGPVFVYLKADEQTPLASITRLTNPLFGSFKAIMLQTRYR